MKGERVRHQMWVKTLFCQQLFEAERHSMHLKVLKTLKLNAFDSSV